ncbi:MarR family winged helix-turn-helix transcriptional regulator [Sphingobium nicotianae]|uniref:MarR family winged helix-turn-helix transcriptional regulator n=1 Tax=Sphingobium nicotianae TaxID=2782607 RepID=A0A9X1AJK9_9SPHN|nr:MarR family winged helix-turn-helix transcriptional regulator [Sphingobium nicotianae]MBT2185851.1 MarR family winged helix-turn-helix transcriptional regulator [Sphingobium nicotianae]
MPTVSLPCVCTSLRKASRAVTRLYDERLAASGLTTTQFAVLRNLRHGDLSLSRLAELLVMDRTSLYRTLAPIERHGWVAITAEDQGRAKQAALTPAGRARMEEATAAWNTCQSEIIGAIGPDQWTALESQLAALVRATTGKAA